MNRIEKRLADMPRDYRKNYLEAIKGDSLRAAINAKCLECMGWLRNEVRDCDCYCCPLHAVRPYQRAQKSHEGGINAVEATISEEMAV